MARKPFDPNLAVGAGGDAPSPAPRERVLTVAEITQRIRDAIESSLPATVYVAGELSNFKKHSSGHCYFTLKDDACEIAGVMWRSDASKLKFAPQDGMDVVVTGSVSVFERAGRYQLYARRIEPRGVGAAELAFRQLCERLKKEGLFDERHKQALPAYPERIGIITSPTGAAIQDIVDTLARRYPCATLYQYPVTVQGPGAARSVATAITAMNRRSEALGGIDVLIVGRGGGSAEDLAAFNDEAVARAIFASRIPIISAVGHETDVTIADFVADVRAATPTAAAELAAPRKADVLDEFAYRAHRMSRNLTHLFDLRRAELASVVRRRVYAEPRSIVRDGSQRVLAASRQMEAGVRRSCDRRSLRVRDLALVVQRLSPQEYVARQRARLLAVQHRVLAGWTARTRREERELTRMHERLVRVSPDRELPARNDRVRELARRIELATVAGLTRQKTRVDADAVRLAAMGYRATLQRGFSITRDKRTGKVVREASAVREGSRIVTQLADGEFESRVVDDKQGELFD
ncbi:MAG: exodeoxyribonuclease VII large subunit [Phycisphaerales bacterium]|nr:exodeoxyribonuclease VII large subunit [Phycisphaerales bacterium]